MSIVIIIYLTCELTNEATFNWSTATGLFVKIPHIFYLPCLSIIIFQGPMKLFFLSFALCHKF